MTQEIRTIRIATQGPAGPAGLYPQGAWSAGAVPYPRATVLAHNGGVWLALRDTSVEPSLAATEDWATWLDFNGMVTAFATLDGGGKIPAAQLPAIAVSDVFTVGSQAAMLALTAEKGDVAIRTDLNRSFMLSSNSPSTLADWKELLTPTDAVLSVASRTGAVVLDKNDVGLGNVPNVDATLRANHSGSQSVATITGLAAVATSGAKADVGLSNVPNTDATNASNISSGTLPDARLSSNVARRDQANTFGDNAISRFSGVLSTQTADYTLAAGDNGTIVYVNKPTAVTVTLPNSLPAGFNCVVVQEGAGQVTFAVASGASKQSPNGASKISIQYGSVSLMVKANSGGSAADWRLDGALGP